MPTLEFTKKVRNNLLIQSDLIIAEITDPIQIDRWMKYRRELRTFFDDKPADFDYTKIIWPRTPYDIDALLAKAAEGDSEAIKIVEKDSL